MILSGLEVQRQIDRGNITIDPYKPQNLNPVSVDLTLGDEIAVYSKVVRVVGNSVNRGLSLHADPNGLIDSAKDNPTTRFRMTSEGFVLKPGIGYLAHTHERVGTDIFVPVLDGKSSIGRLFVKVHETAGFGDPSFNGQYTLEMTVVHPTVVYPGMRIAQIRFQTIQGEITPYTGNYTGSAAEGPVSSKAWRQIARDGLLREDVK